MMSGGWKSLSFFGKFGLTTLEVLFKLILTLSEKPAYAPENEAEPGNGVGGKRGCKALSSCSP